jgi:hypothetical protein
VQILYDGTSLGESLSVSLEYYSIFMTKYWPSLISFDNLPVTPVDFVDLSDVLLQNNTLSAIALGVMSITLEDKDISNCVRLNSTCHVPTPSLSSTIFVTSPLVFGDDEYSSLYVLSNPFTRLDLSIEPQDATVLECLNASSVHLDCSNSTRFGYIFETDLACPGRSDEFVLDRWETTCPVYRTSAECVSPCKFVELVPGVTTCECDNLGFALDLEQEVGGLVAKSANYATFRSESLLSIVYSIDVEIYPELKYIAPEETTASPTSAGGGVIRETVRRPVRQDAWYLLPLILGLCCLFVMFLLLFCRKPKPDEWLKINNSHPCLRSSVLVYDEKFLDSVSEKVSSLCAHLCPALFSALLLFSLPLLFSSFSLSLTLFRISTEQQTRCSISSKRPSHTGKRTMASTMTRRVRVTLIPPVAALPPLHLRRLFLLRSVYSLHALFLTFDLSLLYHRRAMVTKRQLFHSNKLRSLISIPPLNSAMMERHKSFRR